jgi:CheY-like chemotaxis protein
MGIISIDKSTNLLGSPHRIPPFPSTNSYRTPSAQLRAAITKALNAQPRQNEIGADPPDVGSPRLLQGSLPVTPVGSGSRILLVEDNTVNQRVALHALEKAGHIVVLAATGLEALQALTNAKQARQAFNVVLMDVQMPGMDGFEATAAIREKEKTTNRRLPIIAMTAHAMQGDRERCLAAGMDDYISKPIRARELLDLVEKYLRQIVVVS